MAKKLNGANLGDIFTINAYFDTSGRPVEYEFLENSGVEDDVLDAFITSFEYNKSHLRAFSGESKDFHVKSSFQAPGFSINVLQIKKRFSENESSEGDRIENGYMVTLDIAEDLNSGLVEELQMENAALKSAVEKFIDSTGEGFLAPAQTLRNVEGIKKIYEKAWDSLEPILLIDTEMTILRGNTKAARLLRAQNPSKLPGTIIDSKILKASKVVKKVCKTKKASKTWDIRDKRLFKIIGMPFKMDGKGAVKEIMLTITDFTDDYIQFQKMKAKKPDDSEDNG